VALDAGKKVRKTEMFNPCVKFLKVTVENLDGAKALTDVKVDSTLGVLP